MRDQLGAVATAAILLCWATGASATALPVFSVTVNGGPAVSFEDQTACDGTKAVICIGTGSAGDLQISSFELLADPDPYVAGSFNFYNASTTDTLSVVATILFPMTGIYVSPTIGSGTGLVNNVFGGGILNLSATGFADTPGSPIAGISGPPFPFSVCDNPGADPSCQNGVVNISQNQTYPGTLSVTSALGLRLSFDLTPDTTATIGFDPSSAYDSGAYVSVTPAPVPIPGALWLFGSALAAGGLAGRRKAAGQ